MTHTEPQIAALVNLLGDEDRQVSTLAMEQLLQASNADSVVAEFQESQNPLLRNRIHQLGNVLNLRRSRHYFIEGVRDNTLSLWEGILLINYQFNPRLNLRRIERMLNELVRALPRPATPEQVAVFMREQKFAHAKEDVLGADLYLVEDVLNQRVGSPILLAAIAQHLGRQAGWDPAIVLYKGKHCLYQQGTHLIEPADEWRVSVLTSEQRMHPCAEKDIWLAVLCQLYLAALLEGRVQAIHRVGAILATLCGGEFGSLPWPLGS